MRTTTAGRTNVAQAIVLALALAFVGWWVIDLQKQSKALDEAKAVRVLPAGIEEALSVYVDRQLDRTVQPRGDVVKVISLGGTRQFVSRNSPFQVTCAGEIVILSFGRGEGHPMALLYSYRDRVRGAEELPPLGVHPDSVAARGLWSRLCDHVSDRLEDIMTAPEPLPVPPAPPVLSGQRFKPAPPPGPPEPTTP